MAKPPKELPSKLTLCGITTTLRQEPLTGGTCRRCNPARWHYVSGKGLPGELVGRRGPRAYDSGPLSLYRGRRRGEWNARLWADEITVTASGRTPEKAVVALREALRAVVAKWDDALAKDRR